MKWNSRSSETPIRNFVVLLFKVVGKNWTVMPSIRLSPNVEVIVGGLIAWKSVRVSDAEHTTAWTETYSCIHVCIKSQMKGAAFKVVFGELAKLAEGNVPAKKVRLVSGTPVSEKFAGLYWKGDAISSRVPLTRKS
jgi:hypothetical protein